MSAPSLPAVCVRPPSEPETPGLPRTSSQLSWRSEGEGRPPSEPEETMLLDEARKMSASSPSPSPSPRASCSEFLEREYASASCLEEVRALQNAVFAVQQQAAADRAEAEATRASMRDLRKEGLKRLALLEASSALKLQEALQTEREERGGELRDAEERHRAELAAVRAAHESSLSTARREDDGHFDRMIIALQSDVARLRAASDKGSEDLQLTRGAVDSAHQRISELVLEQAQACERVSCLGDTQAQAQVLAAQGGIREAIAESTRQSRGELRQTQGAVEELRAEVRLLAKLAQEQHAAPDARDGAIEDLRAEVSLLKALSVEQARREESIAQKAEQGMAELRADLGRFQQGLERVGRRVEEMAEAGAESSGGADGGTDARVSSLQRLVQDQRRELTVLSSELESLRERHASEAGRSQQALGAIEAFMEGERRLRSGGLEDAAAGARAASGQQERAMVCERVAEIESRTPRGAVSTQQREALPTLLATARAAAADEEAGAVPDSLKDSLQGVVAAVQKVLQDHDAERGPAQAHGPPASPASSPRSAHASARRPVAAVPAPAWRAQQPQRIVVQPPPPGRSSCMGVATIAQQLAQTPPGPVLAIGQHGRGGSVQIAPPGTPLLVRR